MSSLFQLRSRLASLTACGVSATRIVAALLVLFGLAADAVAQGKGKGRGGAASVHERLDAIEEKLDLLIEAAVPGPSVTASFCMSQERALDLGLQFAAGVPIGADLGVGGDVAGPLGEIKYQPFIPGILPVTLTGPVPTFLVPLPNEVALDLGTSHGRGMEICVDLPVPLGPRDSELLQELADDIEDSREPDGLVRGAHDFPFRGKFQRRAHRILNYAKRRVPGVQIRTEPDEGDAVDAAADEFDKLDEAVEKMRKNGLSAEGGGLGLFRDSNVVAFAGSFDETKDLGDFMADPERIFDGLPDRPLRELTCDDLQIADLRARAPKLDDLCVALEDLPSFDLVQNSFATIDGLRDEVLEAIAEIGPEFGDEVGETPAERRERFCRTTLGQRNAFNKYCRR